MNKLDPKHQTIRMSSKIGITRPLYNSAMGKAVLAEFSEEQYTDYLEKHPLIPYTEYTITNALRLKKEIQTVKKPTSHLTMKKSNVIFLYRSLNRENEQIIGAFSVSMPKYRLTDESKEQIISALKQTKSEIEQRIQK